MTSPVISLAVKKVRDVIKFSPSTLIFFITPLLWLVVFLFIRQHHLKVILDNGTVRYIDFLVLGVMGWRTVSEIMSSISKSVSSERSALKALLTAPNGKNILFKATLISSTVISLIVGLFIVLVGIMIYDFSIYYNNFLLGAIVFLLLMIIHIGIGFLFVGLAAIKEGFYSLRYLLTALFAMMSGVFFPVNLYPEPLNHWAMILPFTQGMKLLHDLFLFENAPLATNLLIILTIEAIVFFVLGYYMFKKNVMKYVVK